MTLTVKKSANWSIGQRFNVTGQTSIIAGAGPAGPVISPVGLALYLNAANPASYPGSGTTWYDLSGNGYDATAYGTPTYVATHGGGFNFNSSSDYFDTAPYLRESYAATGLTVAAWVQADSFPFVEGIMERNTWSNSDGWGLYVHFYSKVNGPRFAYPDGGSPTLSTGTPYYLAFTINTAGTSVLYVNGIPAETRSSQGVPTASSFSPTIGKGDYAWPGDVYEIHLYERDLTDSEMLANFNATKARFGL